MNLAIFLNLRFYFDGKTYTADERYFEFWMCLSSRLKKLVLCVPVLETTLERGTFKVTLGPNVEVFPLPFYRSSLRLYVDFSLSRRIRTLFAPMIEGWDVVGAVVPNQIGYVLLKEAIRNSKPCFAFMRGDLAKTVKFEFGRNPLKYPAWLFSLYLEARTRRILCKCPAIVVGGGELYRKYKRPDNKVFRLVVSLIHARDIHQKSDLPKDLRIPKLLYLGRISGEKGLGYLIEAIHMLKARFGMECRLTVVGSGPEEEREKGRANLLGVGDQVCFTGYIPYGPELKDIFRRSDIFVLPSLTEGFPKVVLEAMANGLPVVASNVGGIPEIIESGVNGLLVPPGDPGALAGAIYRLVFEEQLRYAILQRSYETIKEYTIEKQTERLFQLLESELGVKKTENALGGRVISGT